MIRIPHTEAKEFLANYKRQQQEATRIDMFSQKKGRQIPGTTQRRESEGIRIVPGITKRDLNSGETIGPSSSRQLAPSVGLLGTRETAALKVSHEAAPIGSYQAKVNQVYQPTYTSSPYTQQSYSWQQAQPSTQWYSSPYISPQSYQPTLPLQVPPSPAGVHMLGSPQPHTLQGFNLSSDLDSTLQRIINRAFN